MATSEADPGEAERHLSECPVCLQVYVDPKVLPCDHSLCAGCVKKLKQDSRIECPLCKVVHDVSSIKLCELCDDKLRLNEVQPFDFRDVIILRTVQGRIGPGGQDPNVHGFLNLREKLFVRQKVVKLVNCPGSVQYIKDDVWMCQRRKTVQIFDQNLECLRKFSDQQWGNVRRVTELPNGDVVLAGYGGLYHLTAAGETKTAIDAVNIYNSSVFIDDKLFASCWNPPRLIVYTMQNDRWKKRDTICLASVVKPNACLTLATANGKIFACSDDDGEVLVLSQSGEVLQTHGKPEHAYMVC